MMLIQNLGIFLEMNKVNLSFQRNNWQYLSPMIKFRLSSENENFGKLVSATVKLPNSLILQAISDKTGGNINKDDFSDTENEKNIQHLEELYITQWISTFQMNDPLG